MNPSSPRYLGVLDGYTPPDFKKGLLLFDELVLPDRIYLDDGTLPPSIRADLEWLEEEGLLSRLDYKRFRAEVLAPERHTFGGVIRTMAGSYLLVSAAASTAFSDQVRSGYDRGIEIGLGGFVVMTQRIIAATLAEEKGIRAAPIVPGQARGSIESIISNWPEMFERAADALEAQDEIASSLGTEEDRKWFRLGCKGFVSSAERFLELQQAGEIDLPTERDAIAVTIDSIPVLTDRVSLTDVADFMRDPETAQKRTRLHRWLNRLSVQDVTADEIQDQLHDYMESYSKHMEAAELEHRTSWLETVITVPAEIAEKLVRMKFGDAAKSFFKLRRVKARLLKEELDAPGREVAYLVEVNDRFGGFEK